jgi:hypothetical protein
VRCVLGWGGEGSFRFAKEIFEEMGKEKVWVHCVHLCLDQLIKLVLQYIFLSSKLKNGHFNISFYTFI